jgi:hypothetical protein
MIPKNITYTTKFGTDIIIKDINKLTSILEPNKYVWGKFGICINYINSPSIHIDINNQEDHYKLIDKIKKESRFL